MDRRTDCQLWVGSWLHVSRLAQLVGLSPCLCAELPCHVPCFKARAPAAPTAGKLAVIEALTSALCSCGWQWGQVGAGIGPTLLQGPLRPGVPSLPNEIPYSKACRVGAPEPRRLRGKHMGRGSEFCLAPGTRE